MKAGPLLGKAIDILAYDLGGHPNPDYQFSEEEDRQAIETTEVALAKLDGKNLSDILYTVIEHKDDKALDTFVCGEAYAQAALTQYLGEPGVVAWNLICRIFDGDLSGVIIYDDIYRTTQPCTQW